MNNAGEPLTAARSRRLALWREDGMVHVPSLGNLEELLVGA